MPRNSLLLVLLALVSALFLQSIDALASPNTREVKGRLFIPDTRDVAGVIGVEAEVTLDFGRYRGGIRRDGSFVIRDVPSGIYILEVDSTTHAFDKLWVEVDTVEGSVRASQYFPATEYDPSPKRMVPYPIELTAKGQFDYFQVREGFNWMGMLQNPMMLMAVASIGMVYLLPKMMEGIPPEELAASREAQARMFGGGGSRTAAGGQPAPQLPNVDIAEQLARWSTGAK
ncbi:hypothetical protein HDU93_007397 [Gonapodya sp. JEL0774]|nr:hypothetical protein HDU93_007397 [Gonapodya sp. JEL0774]